MSSINNYKLNEIKKDNENFSAIRSIVETSFFSNTVKKINNISKAYNLAKKSLGVIVTDLPVKHTKELGLPSNAKVLVFNDGLIVGRTSAARKIIGQPGINEPEMEKIVREAMYHLSRKETITTDVIVGLSKDFMIKSHVLVPKGFESNILAYMLNFQPVTSEYNQEYLDSKPYDFSDILIVADPDWTHPDYPHGLVIFDYLHNTAVVLGLRYFGELKKGTLTLAWAAAHRNNFIACHGGIKQYIKKDNSTYTMAAFGLSGSGKSTITLSENKDKYDVLVLHDDAFVINKASGASTALEPSYFDKTQDYPSDHPKIDYFVSCMNVGVTLDDNNRKVLVNEDIRNGNGRCIKSRYVTSNRIDYLDQGLDGIYWIMKDDSLPPIIKIDDPILAAIFGLTLATKRSTAENLVGDVDRDALVIEPYANPFRTYPLNEDYQDFKSLFEGKDTSCYILNTGFFNENKVQPKHTLGCIESIVDNTAQWLDFSPIKGLQYQAIDGLSPDFNDKAYIEKLIFRMENRLDFIQAKRTDLEGYNALPEETEQRLSQIINDLKNYIK